MPSLLERGPISSTHLPILLQIIRIYHNKPLVGVHVLQGGDLLRQVRPIITEPRAQIFERIAAAASRLSADGKPMRQETHKVREDSPGSVAILQSWLHMLSAAASRSVPLFHFLMDLV